ncbi:HAAAP family serine/threonine permease [Propionivibrio sp.]|uniref:HAAAP family serine/threonine permease n=1 Tax=Propionivibrio sp. TaxID=2212460 RepID=UPI003BF06AC2
MKKEDFFWSLSLFGTAVGAGILFLPITVGIGGLWPFVMMALLAFPMTFYSHRGLARFVLVGKGNSQDITVVADESFGSKIGFLITTLYFLAIFSILLVYSVALTNTINSIISDNLHLSPPPRVLLAGILTLFLMCLVQYGEEIIIRAISFLVFPFVAAIFTLSLYMIPTWNGGIFEAPTPDFSHFAISMLYIIPVMVFSFNHSPIISSMVLAQKRTYNSDAEPHINKILLCAHFLIVGVVVFFVFSCAMTFSGAQLQEAKVSNVTILTYMATVFHNPVLHNVAPIIAVIAITKSFLGHFMGTKEGFIGILRRAPFVARYSALTINKISLVVIGLCVWIVAVYNPSALDLIDDLSGPILAIILFLMPAYAVRAVPAMRKYAGPDTYFVAVIGLLALGSIILQFI